MARVSVVLIRHGLSALAQVPGFIDRLEILAWQEEMDAVGIASDAHPPEALLKLGATFDHVIASTMPRAIESAERLFPGRDVEISPLFREAPPEFPTWLPLRWPLGFWKFATGSQWIYRIARGTDTSPEDRGRVSAAAQLLRERARERTRIAVISHGVFRRLLGLQLERDGWTRGPGRQSYDNWSAWEYTTDVVK
jgi:broad specificity phosphatase PhoE